MYVLVWFRYLEPHAIFRYTWSRYLRPCVCSIPGIDMCSCIWVCFFSAHGTIIRYHVREKEIQVIYVVLGQIQHFGLVSIRTDFTQILSI